MILGVKHPLTSTGPQTPLYTQAIFKHKYIYAILVPLTYELIAEEYCFASLDHTAPQKNIELGFFFFFLSKFYLLNRLVSMPIPLKTAILVLFDPSTEKHKKKIEDIEAFSD